jgi:hypothetical protein
MSSGWVQLPDSAITYCWTDDYRLHRGLSPYGEAWNTACDVVARSLPDGVQPGSASLIRCRECFPVRPPERLSAWKASRG